MKKIMNVYNTEYKLQVNNDELECRVVAYGYIIEIAIFVNKKWKNTLHYCNFDGIYDIVDDIISWYENEMKVEFPKELIEQFEPLIDSIGVCYEKACTESDELEEELKGE